MWVSVDGIAGSRGFVFSTGRVLADSTEFEFVAEVLSMSHHL
jgi:hypothetical protein